MSEGVSLSDQKQTTVCVVACDGRGPGVVFFDFGSQTKQWKLRATNGARDLRSSRPTDSPLALAGCAYPHWYRTVVFGMLRSYGPSRRRNPKVGPDCTSGERG